MLGPFPKSSSPGIAPGFFFAKRTFSICFLLLACTLPFLPGVHGPFLLDDVGNLVRARATSGNLVDVLDAIVRNETGLLRRPLSNASFLLNYHWFGGTPFHYKVVNLAIHFGNGVLVWLFLRRLFRLVLGSLDSVGQGRVALFVALVWTVHPLQVSTVLYPVQRMAELSALFALASVYAGLGAISRLQTEDHTLWQGARAALLVLSLTLLAVLSKENGILAPALLLCALVCLPAGQLRQAWSQPTLRLFFWLAIALPLLIGLVAGTLMFPTFLEGYSMREFSMLERTLTQPAVLGNYLSTIVWPDIRRMGLYLDDIPIRSPYDPLAWLGTALAVLVPLLAWLLRRRAPVLAWGILWFATAHLLESTIIPLELAFEHRNYVAMLGPLVILSHYGARGFSTILQARARALIAAVLLLALASQTLQRSQQWSSFQRFTLAEAANHPQSPRALGQAAAYYFDLGDVASASDLIFRAQQLRPSSFWFRAYDVHLACLRGDASVDTSVLLNLAQDWPDQAGIDAAARAIVIKVLSSECRALDEPRLDEFLRQLIEAVAAARQSKPAERLLILRSMVASQRGDDEQWRTMLRLAAFVNPESVESLTALAYGELNRDNIAGARSAANELETRLRNHHRAVRLFELDELHRNIAQAEEAARP